MWNPLENIKVRVYTILAEPKLQWQNEAIWSDALELLLPDTHGKNSGLVGDTYDDLYKNVTRFVNSGMNLKYNPAAQFVYGTYGDNVLRFPIFE